MHLEFSVWVFITIQIAAKFVHIAKDFFPAYQAFLVF